MNPEPLKNKVLWPQLLEDGRQEHPDIVTVSALKQGSEPDPELTLRDDIGRPIKQSRPLNWKKITTWQMDEYMLSLEGDEI